MLTASLETLGLKRMFQRFTTKRPATKRFTRTRSATNRFTTKRFVTKQFTTKRAMECCTVMYFYEDQLTKGINNACMMSHITQRGRDKKRETHRHKEMDRQIKTDEKQAIHTDTRTHRHTHRDKETDENKEQETKRRWRNTHDIDADTGTK